MPMTNPKWIDVDGVKTRYFEAGSGEPLVLFFGGNFGSDEASNSAIVWNWNFDGLAQWYRVFAVDKLGQGFTDNPKRDEDYTMAAVVNHAHGFLRALGLRHVHLAGHSRGGYLVCRLTLEHPEIVKSCTIIDSATLAPGVERNEIVFAGNPHPLLSREGQRWVYERYSYNPKIVTEDWLDESMAVCALPKYRESVRKMKEEGLNGRMFLPQLQRQKRDTHARINELGMRRPTQLVWGFNDPTAPISMGYALYRMIAAHERQAYLRVLNEAGHYSFREHPKAFNETVHGFIQSL